MKNLLFTAMMMLLSLTASAQTLERMQWFNEPDNWKISNNKLAMQVTPRATIGVSLTMGLP